MDGASQEIQANSEEVDERSSIHMSEGTGASTVVTAAQPHMPRQPRGIGTVDPRSRKRARTTHAAMQIVAASQASPGGASSMYTAGSITGGIRRGIGQLHLAAGSMASRGQTGSAASSSSGLHGPSPSSGQLPPLNASGLTREVTVAGAALGSGPALTLHGGDGVQQQRQQVRAQLHIAVAMDEDSDEDEGSGCISPAAESHNDISPVQRRSLQHLQRSLGMDGAAQLPAPSPTSLKLGARQEAEIQRRVRASMDGFGDGPITSMCREMRPQLEKHLMLLLSQDRQQSGEDVQVQLPQGGHLFRGAHQLTRYFASEPKLHQNGYMYGPQPDKYGVQTRPGVSSQDPFYSRTYWSVKIRAVEPTLESIAVAAVCQPVATRMLGDLIRRGQRCREMLMRRVVEASNAALAARGLDLQVSMTRLMQFINDEHPFEREPWMRRLYRLLVGIIQAKMACIDAVHHAESVRALQPQRAQGNGADGDDENALPSLDMGALGRVLSYFAGMLAADVGPRRGRRQRAESDGSTVISVPEDSDQPIVRPSVLQDVQPPVAGGSDASSSSHASAFDAPGIEPAPGGDSSSALLNMNRPPSRSGASHVSSSLSMHKQFRKGKRGPVLAAAAESVKSEPAGNKDSGSVSSQQAQAEQSDRSGEI